jgi:Lhr-like helicase
VACGAPIKEVHFERVFNLGNYETFRIGLTATVGPKQTAEEVAGMLDDFTVKIRNTRVRDKNKDKEAV